MGPGIMTVNETDRYTWPDFAARCTNAVEGLFNAHPATNELRVEYLTLRYIDAVEVDFAKVSVFTFLRDKMKTQLSSRPPVPRRPGEQGPRGVHVASLVPQRCPWRSSHPPLRQGDIFLGVPKIDLSLQEVLLAEPDGEWIAKWEELARGSGPVTIIVPVRPVAAIVATQDCDTSFS